LNNFLKLIGYYIDRFIDDFMLIQPFQSD